MEGGREGGGRKRERIKTKRETLNAVTHFRSGRSGSLFFVRRCKSLYQISHIPAQWTQGAQSG